MGAIESAVARGRIKMALFMKDDAVIKHPGQPTQSAYGVVTPGTPTLVNSKCSIFPMLDGKEAEQVTRDKLKGRAGWLVVFPYGTNINRTCTVTVTTVDGNVFPDLEVLSTLGKQTRALRVEADCAQNVKAPAIP